MRPIAEHSIEQMQLCASRRIITYYLRYTLLRCASFTNTRADAERIAFYTLVTTCLLARELRNLRQLSGLIDLMVDVVARDQAAEHGRPKPDKNPADSALLIDNRRMLNLSRAINTLDRFTRELMVLYHVESMDTAKLSHLFGTSVAGIRAEIAEGQRRLAACLNRLRPKPGQVRPRDAVLLLHELRNSLNLKWGERLAACTFSYVAMWLKQKAPDSPCWNLN